MPIMSEYLVKLGSVVDQSGMAQFYQALREASNVASSSAKSIAGSMINAQTAIVGGFATVGGAIIGMVDKVAMADQSYRLFGMHMFMQKDQARSLKVALDALGESMEDVAWDPELRARAHQLIMDQRAMAPTGDFDAQMKKVRDIRFEFTRFQVELEYLGMHTVQTFLNSLGTGPDDLLKRLQGVNEWIIKNVPEIASKAVTWFKPLMGDMKLLGSSMEEALKSAGLAFTNLVGLLSGDKSIMGTEFNFKNLGVAIRDTIHEMALFAITMTKFEGAGAHILSAAALWKAGDKAGAAKEWQAAKDETLSDPVTQFLHPLMGALGGKVDGPNLFDPGAAQKIIDESKKRGMYAEVITNEATKRGLSGDFMNSLAMAESSGSQTNADGSIKIGTNLDGTHTSARGLFQLTDAATMDAVRLSGGLMLNRDDAKDNATLASYYMQSLQQRYTTGTKDHKGNNLSGGDLEAAMVAAYHDGMGTVDKVLAHGLDKRGNRVVLSDLAVGEVQKVLAGEHKYGDFTVGDIVIHVAQPAATAKEIGQHVKSTIKDMQAAKTQQNLQQAQGAHV